MILPTYTRLYTTARRLWDRGLIVLGSAALAAAIVQRARAHLGEGEEGANNRGPYLRAIGAGGGAAWCAAWVSTILAEAYELLELPCPIEHTLGAKALYRRCLRHGVAVRGRDVRPGDIVCLDRGQLGDWRGHVAIVVDATAPDDGRYVTIDGNVGAYPALVSYHERRFADRRLIGFARLSLARS